MQAARHPMLQPRAPVRVEHHHGRCRMFRPCGVVPKQTPGAKYALLAAFSEHTHARTPDEAAS